MNRATRDTVAMLDGVAAWVGMCAGLVTTAAGVFALLYVPHRWHDLGHWAVFASGLAGCVAAWIADRWAAGCATRPARSEEPPGFEVVKPTDPPHQP